MRLRLFITFGIFASLLVGAALAQSDTDGSVSWPTATLSPRAMVGIFQTLRVNYGLELDSDIGFASYPEISTLIQLFANQYLDIDAHMPYSSQIFVGFMGYDQFHRMAGSFSQDVRMALNQYLMSVESLPMASVGLRKDGLAILYTGRCNSPICNTPQEHMQRYQRDALGIYVIFVPGEIEGQDEALDLILQTFPRLQKPGLGVVNAGEDYTFALKTFREIDGVKTPLLYYAGALTIPRYTLVYVMVGVGEDASRIINLHS